MLFLLLGLSICEATKLCLRSADTNKCPEGLPDTSIVADEDALIAKIVAGGTYSIYIDSDITKLTQDHLPLIVEITAIKTGAISVAATISTAATCESITLTGITLDIQKANPAKLLANTKVTYNQVTINPGSSIKAASVVSIKTLYCTSVPDAKKAIAFMADTDANIIIEGTDVLDGIEVTSGGTTGVSIRKGGDTLDAAAEGMKVTIISTTTTSDSFSLQGDCSTIAPTVDVTLVYGNAGIAIITFQERNFVKSSKISVKVNTYYMKDNSVKENGEAVCTFDEQFLVTSAGRTVPIAPTYCLYQSSQKDDPCPEKAQHLWYDSELAGTKNGDNMVTVFLSGFDTNGLSLVLKDYVDRAIVFSGLAKDKQQIIDFTCEKKDESVTGSQQFNSISVTVTVPKDSADASLSFKNLLVTNSDISAAEATAPSPSRKLKAVGEIKVNSEDLTSDAASFTAFKAQKPSNSFSVANPKSLDFSGDGSKVTIDTVDFTKDSIPVPFNIVTLPGQDLKDVTLKIDSDNGSPGKVLPFAFDVKEGSNLSVKYSGDWSSNTIVVNVAAGSSFAGKKASENDKSPVMEKQGSGTATLDDKVLVVASPPASPKSGLGGGPIAGIVIACVVVVAAVGIAVFFVIKKKKSQVNC